MMTKDGHQQRQVLNMQTVFDISLVNKYLILQGTLGDEVGHHKSLSICCPTSTTPQAVKR